MKALKAIHASVKLGGEWESPPLHILLTFEDDVYVARCLDFLVSSHGTNETEALESLTLAIRGYIISAAENDALDTLADPARDKYWRLFSTLDSTQISHNIQKSFAGKQTLVKNFSQMSAKLCYA